MIYAKLFFLLLTAVVSFGFVLTNSFLAVGDFCICVYEQELCAILRINLKETQQISVHVRISTKSMLLTSQCYYTQKNAEFKGFFFANYVHKF